MYIVTLLQSVAVHFTMPAGVPVCAEFENLVGNACEPCGDAGLPVCDGAHACNLRCQLYRIEFQA